MRTVSEVPIVYFCVHWKKKGHLSIMTKHFSPPSKGVATIEAEEATASSLLTTIARKQGFDDKAAIASSKPVTPATGLGKMEPQDNSRSGVKTIA